MAIRYLSGINVDSNTLFVDSTNNRVGIGTGSPGYRLQVNGDAAFFSAAGSLNSIITQGSEGKGRFYLYDGGNATIALQTNGPSYFNAGNVLIGTTTDNGSTLNVNGSGFFSSNLQTNSVLTIGNQSGAGNYILQITPSTTVPVALQGILAGTGAAPISMQASGGNVLIGTTTDAGYKLRVNGSSYFDAPILSYTGNGYITAITSDGVGSNNGFGYSFLITGANHEIGRVTGIYETSGGGGSGGLGFWTRGSGTLSAKMTLNSGGTLTLSNYGSGYKTGTATYGLAVDSSGNIIEVTSTIDGSGTANYVTKWQDSNTLTNSVIYDNGTNVSIGTTANPGSRTNIYLSEAGATPNAILRLQNTGSQYLAKMIITDGNTNDAVIGYQGGVTSATQYLGFGIGTAITQMVLNAAGNVGIGTTAPQPVSASWTTLEVQGQSTGGGGIVYTANNGATVKSHFYTDGTSGFVGTQTNHYFGFTTNNQERARFTAGGNLLIGTTTDAAHLLYVNGSARFNGVAYAASRLMVGITSDQSYASIFVGGDITTGSSQYALLLDPQLSGTSNYGLLANARIKASTAATNAYGVYILNNELLSGASVVNNYGLYIANQTSGSSVNYALYSAGGTSYFAGNVGIGTTSPSALLHVSQASANTVFRLGNNASYDQFIYFNGNNDWSLGMDYSNSNAFVLSNASSIGTNDRVVVTTGGDVGIGTTTVTFDTGSGLRIERSGASTIRLAGEGAAAEMSMTSSGYQIDSRNGYIRFITGAASGTAVERMRITAAGNVGINSGASSVYVLDVYSKDTAYNTRLYQPSTATDTYVSLILSGAMTSAIGYMGTGGSTAGNVAFRDNVVVGSQSNHPLVFNTNDGERARFTAGGNLLIGTTTDAGYKLQVEGSVRSVGAMEPSNTTWINAAFTTKVGGSAYGGGLALIDGTAGWATYTTGSGQFLNFSSGATSGGVTMRMRLQNNGVVRMSAYGSGGVTGTAAYSLSVDANGDIIESASPLNATSLYDLLPAGRVAYNWVGQVVDDTWTTVFTKNDSILTTGTWMVKMYVNDFGVGGGHYQYVYSGIMTWDQGTVNQTGEAAFSEVYLHRMGHAANASILYLRTAESGAAGGNIGYFQIKGNYSNTSNQTIQFQFVKIF